MKKLLILLIILFQYKVSFCQNDVMLQAFYWDVPVNANSKNGSWYDTIAQKISLLKAAGIRQIWLPPPSKGNWSIYDMGYGIYDHYDLGQYYQLGTIETRFGSFRELRNLIQIAHDTMGGSPIQVLSDMVLNHMYSHQLADYEPNPALKRYIAQSYKMCDTNRQVYPADEFVWVLFPDSSKVFSAQIRRYSERKSRTWDGSILIHVANHIEEVLASSDIPPVYVTDTDTLYSENFYFSQIKSVQSKQHINLYRNHISDTLYLKILPRNKQQDRLVWTNQDHGILITDSNGIIPEPVQVYTTTGINTVNKIHQPKLIWNYSHFHPSAPEDYMHNSMQDDRVTESMKIFGHDLNHYHPEVLSRLGEWGRWIIDSVGFDGFRFDFVQGIDEQYMIKWVNYVWSIKNVCGPMVAEYFSWNKQRLSEWGKLINNSIDKPSVKLFDFPLKYELTQMCNLPGTDFDMGRLRYAGMSNDPVYNLPDSLLVSFVDNHDTGKESDKWVQKDWMMAYAFILFAPQQPCIFYNHFFGTTQTDYLEQSTQLEIPLELGNYITRLIKIRNGLPSGEYISLPEENKHCFIAKRTGNSGMPGALLAMNNSDTDTLTVEIPADQLKDLYWGKEKLTDAISGAKTLVHWVSDELILQIPPRSSLILTTQAEYEKQF